jgi:hypothetical protein
MTGNPEPAMVSDIGAMLDIGAMDASALPLGACH